MDFVEYEYSTRCGTAAGASPWRKTQTPITTGTSVVALRFDGGVIMAADTLGSYGSMARYRGLQRLIKANDSTIVGCMGDYADFQFLKQYIDQDQIIDYCHDDGFKQSPRSVLSWMRYVLYNQRSRIDPLWCTVVVGGLEDNDQAPEGKKEFLGAVDMNGTAYTDPVIATGFGMHFATPMMRKAVEDKTRNGGQLNEAEARKIIQDCMKVLYCRDGRAFKMYQIGIINRETKKTEIEGPFEIEVDWSVHQYVRGYE